MIISIHTLLAWHKLNRENMRSFLFHHQSHARQMTPQNLGNLPLRSVFSSFQQQINIS